ncbi:Uncharacterised protein [Mycobacterium tuberculosis]|nr:Uncharacterised protein [Mycobacterium tuberculosis]
MAVQPGVALGDRAVVHVVVGVRDDKRHRRQAGVILRLRKCRKRHRQCRRHVTEVDPRHVFACVFARTAHRGADRRQVFGEPHECVTGAEQLRTQVGQRAAVDGAGVLRQPECVASEQCQVVRFARVCFGERLGHHRAVGGQRIDEGSRLVTDDGGLRAVLLHHDDHVREGRQGTRCQTHLWDSADP